MRTRFSFRIVAMLAQMMVAMVAYANEYPTVEVNGLNYILIDSISEAYVTDNPTIAGEVVIPNEIEVNGKSYDVTYVRSSAFRNNTAITSVKIGDNMKGLWTECFYGCGGLTSIEVPENVNQIQSGVFAHCTNLKTAIIKNANPSINSVGGIFSECYSLEKVVLPSEMTIIPDFMFINCTSLKRIDLPKTLNEIGDYVFTGCSALEEITLGDNITKLGYHVFSDCVSLATINYNMVNDIEGIKAFDGCTGLKTINIGESVCNFNFSFFEGSLGECVTMNIDSPNLIDFSVNYPIKYPQGITEVNFGDNVTSIGARMLADCTTLEKVTLGKNVGVIRDSAFEGCSALQNIVMLGKNVGVIWDSAFEGCSALQNIVLPESLYYIGGSVFKGCSKLKQINLVDGVGEIASNTFEGCSQLETVTMGDNVSVIGERAFDGCNALKNLELPQSVLSIGEKAFNNCSSLKEFVIPDIITEIENNIFGGCTGLEKVTIGKGVTTVAANSFSSCNALKTVVMNAKNCTSMGTVDRRGKIATAFGSNNTVITTIELGAEVTNLPKYAFYGCSSATTITSNAVVPPTCVALSLDGVDKTNCKLYVPEGALNAYKNAEIWKDFVNIEELASSAVEMVKTEDSTPIEYFNLEGVRVENPKKGVYVKKRGGKTEKVILGNFY